MHKDLLSICTGSVVAIWYDSLMPGTETERGPASPAVRRQILGTELRRLRERTNRSGDHVARVLKWSPSKVSRYELARTALKLTEIAALLDLYKVAGDERDRLMALAEAAAGKAWWEQDGIPAAYQEVISLENEAAAISAWSAAGIPALLQTGAYARHAVTSWGSVDPAPPALVDRLVAARLTRQKILTRDPAPCLAVVLDEAALRRMTGSPAVMREQLQSLARPGVSLRVLPFTAPHPAFGDSFTVIRVEALSAWDVVVMEDAGHGYHLIKGEREAFLHGIAFRQLADAALDETASRALIRDAARTWS